MLCTPINAVQTWPCSSLAAGESYLPRFCVHRSFLVGGRSGEGGARAQREGTVTTGAQRGALLFILIRKIFREPECLLHARVLQYWMQAP